MTGGGGMLCKLVVVLDGTASGTKLVVGDNNESTTQDIVHEAPAAVLVNPIMVIAVFLPTS